MSILLGVYVFILGLLFGSFALAMVDRMKAGKDWVKGRSQCDHCGHKLSALDLIPVISWVVQKGKCRYCKKELSTAYPVVELLTGSTFLASYIFLPYELSGYGLMLFSLWLFALVLMSALVVFDARWFLLPNKLIYPLIGVGIAHRVIYILDSEKSLTANLGALVLSILAGAGVFWVLHVISKGIWIGDGDVRLGVAIGLFLAGPIEAWLAIFTASIVGVIVAIPQLKKGKKALRMKLPFGPMLIFGLAFIYLFGEKLIDWYSTVFLFY